MAFTALTTAQTDADSPLNSILFGTIKANFDDHETRIGTVEGNGWVSQPKLKSTTGSVSRSLAGAAQYTLPGGEYGFFPQLKSSNASLSGAAGLFCGETGASLTTLTGLGTSYVTNITLVADGTYTIYAQQRYVQSSPPYRIGDVLWGHFLFLLRKATTGEVVSAYEAEDPPWAYNGVVYLPKDDPGRLSEVPHPFIDYWLRDPATDGLEIVMVDFTMRDVKRAKQDNAKLGRGLLEDVPALIAGKGKKKTHADYQLPYVARFSEQVKIYEP